MICARVMERLLNPRMVRQVTSRAAMQETVKAISLSGASLHDRRFDATRHTVASIKSQKYQSETVRP
jgi:hypothetical protein